MKKILITGVGKPVVFFEYIHFKPQSDLKFEKVKQISEAINKTLNA